MAETHLYNASQPFVETHEDRASHELDETQADYA